MISIHFSAFSKGQLRYRMGFFFFWGGGGGGQNFKYFLGYA